jgi:glycosyltransferase involved in cell wall biosynthesis/SAM-dependent methyltransferase
MTNGASYPVHAINASAHALGQPDVAPLGYLGYVCARLPAARMRTLIVAHYTLPHAGGIEVLVDDLGRRLARDGHQVTVVSSRDGMPAYEERDGIRIIRVAAWNVLEHRLHVPYPIFAPSLLPVLWRAVREADVVHVHGVLYLSSLCALLAAWWQRKPLVVTEHVGFVPYRNRFLSAIQRSALALCTPPFLRRADAVIAYNTTVHAWLAAQTPYPERLHYVANGIDTDRFRPPSAAERAAARQALGITSDRPVVLFVGRFVEKKRVDLLLDGGDLDFELVLCGRGELPASAARPGVHVVRDVEHARMPEIYRASDVFVLPSHGEGFPVAVMEALASGLPVVAVRDSAYDEYVGPREMVQTDASAASVQAAIRTMLADEEERRLRAAAARQRAVAVFSLDACAAHHLDIYRAARGARALSNELAALGHDLASQLKVPVLRSLRGSDPPAPWADVGPGSGYAAHHVFGPGAIVIVDISHANLQRLRVRAQQAGYPRRFLPVRGDLAALPFRDGALGTVLCTEVLEHLADDGRAAAELVRTLAPRGRLVVEVPHLARGYASYLERLGVTTVHDVPGPEFHHRAGYTRADLSALFTPRGGVITGARAFAGFVTLFLMDTVAAIHLLYERRRGRTAWTWSDVEQVTNSPVFAVYRAVFPILRALTRLDAIVSRGAGFILGARVEKDGAR